MTVTRLRGQNPAYRPSDIFPKFTILVDAASGAEPEKPYPCAQLRYHPGLPPSGYRRQ